MSKKRLKPASQRKVKCMSIWFTEDQFRRVKAAAGEKSPSSWCREGLLSLAAIP